MLIDQFNQYRLNNVKIAQWEFMLIAAIIIKTSVSPKQYVQKKNRSLLIALMFFDVYGNGGKWFCLS